jgi:hypothetical protein
VPPCHDRWLVSDDLGYGFELRLKVANASTRRLELRPEIGVDRGCLSGRQPVRIDVESRSKLVDHLHRGIARVRLDTRDVRRRAAWK